MGGGGCQGEAATRNTMRTKRKRILCTTNTSDILQEHEILNFISVPAGTTLMTVTFSKEDLEKLKLEGILNGIITMALPIIKL